MEAESFIEENGYTGADEAQLDEVRQEVISSAAHVPMDRATVEFAARVSKRFHVPIRFVDDTDIDGAYDPSQRTILLNRNATQSDVIRKLFAHELAHRTESSQHYAELRDALLQLRYNGDSAAQNADLNAIRAQYAGVYDKDADFESELVATKAEELLGNEDSINRIVDQKPSLASRIWQTLKGFVKRIAGIQSSQADRIRQAETLFRKALETVGIKTTGEMQFALKDTATIPWIDQVDMTANKQIPGSSTLTVTNGLTLMPQIGEQNLPVGMYISDFRKVTRDTSGNRSAHGLSLDTMRAFPEALSNPVAWFDNPSRNSLYVVTSLTDGQGLPVVAIINKNQTDNAGAPMHRLISAYGMRNILQYMEDHLPDGARYFVANKEAFSMMAGSQYTMTESDYRSLENRFTEIVPQESDAVNTPVTDSLSGIQFSNPAPVLPSPEIRAAQMADYHAKFVSGAFDGGNGNGNGGSVNGETGALDNSTLGERQFTTKTLPRNMAIPMPFKNELFRNPRGRYYVRDSNRGQIARAVVRLEQDGLDATVARLESMDHIADKDDVAMITLLTGLANAPAEIGGLDDQELLSRMLLLTAEQGTEIGQALQARQIFDRLSPMEQQARLQGNLEKGTMEYADKHPRKIKGLLEQAQQVEDKIRDLQGGDDMLRLTEGTVVNESNNRWGIPVNEQQQALIDHYGLNHVPRPGLFYNRATVKQRMLEAILASPNPLALTGMGMNLIHRLELLNAGIPVTTVADNNYIGQNLTEYAYADHDTQNTREGRIPLARAFEAYANITPATSKTKLRTIRYINMLMRGGSAARNVIGNAVQTAVNEVSHAVSTALDTGVSLFTHERTTAIVPAKGQIEGFKAFAKGFMEQVRDIYFDRVNTQENVDRYRLTEHGGRVFQSSIPEALRNFEVFLMSMGDRPFFQRAYATSMAESHKLARINGVELDYTQAHERAMQEALFATFNEDSAVRNAIQNFKRTGGLLGEALDFIIPFTGVPTNIIRRSYQYSPAYLVSTALRHAYRAARGESFDQRAFVQELGRGLTGTGLFILGAALYCGGFIRLGTSEEDDDKKRQLMSADGAQYAATLDLGDVQINLAAFNPAAITIGWGAHAIEELDKLNRENPDPNAVDYVAAIFNALCRGGDLIFDASYMSSLSDFLGGSGYEGFTTQGALNTLASSAVSQFTPGVLADLASGLDPYVRDTKDANAVTQIVKSLANRIPGLRQMLPAKVDVTGQHVENTDYGVVALFDPFNRTYERDDPAIDELMRLQEALGSSGFMPSDALSGTRTSLSGVEAPVEDKDKEIYKRRYGTLWRTGGNTYDKDGNVVHVMGVNELIQQPWYQQLPDAEKAEHIKSVVAAAKTGAAYEAGEKLGHKDKVSSTTAKSTTGEHTAAPLRAAPDKLAGQYPELDRLFAETGDGTFIPKGISNTFQRGGVKYTLADEDYEELWQLYEMELDVRLWTVNYYKSQEEVAAQVEKAYSDAAKEARDKYVKFYGPLE